MAADTDPTLYCTFCDKSYENVSKLIASPGPKPRASICDECVEVCNEILKDGAGPVLSETEIEVRLDRIKSLVVGQEEAVRRFGLLVRSHLQRQPRAAGPKTNVLLVGPRACGKSHLVQCAADVLELPIVFVNATRILEHAYLRGRSPVASLIASAEGNSERASHGILCIENLELIADPAGTNPEGRRTQRALPLILDGTEGKAWEENFPTRGLLIVGCGTFVSAGETLRIRTPEDLIALGFLPEVATRFTHVVEFQDLGERHLVGLVKEAISPSSKYFDGLFGNVQVQFSEEAVEVIAKAAARRSAGARSLYATLEEVALVAALKCTDDDGLTTFLVDGAFAESALG
jgi:ATP-dependent Clp protease ATP-binding subunit ClpX